mmetsp:Transcript_46001/g.146923  ORF Transcript_46001/g.146923 Transcript_46001/m.146923 type:complete len:217 (-) Transcript_46001:356-1006(-)
MGAGLARKPGFVGEPTRLMAFRPPRSMTRSSLWARRTGTRGTSSRRTTRPATSMTAAPSSRTNSAPSSVPSRKSSSPGKYVRRSMVASRSRRNAWEHFRRQAERRRAFQAWSPRSSLRRVSRATTPVKYSASSGCSWMLALRDCRGSSATMQAVTARTVQCHRVAVPSKCASPKESPSRRVLQGSPMQQTSARPQRIQNMEDGEDWSSSTTSWPGR